MITVAKRRVQRGQSMIEFAFLVPIIVGMLVVLVQVEMAISSAIVNNKYARQSLHFFFWNHRYYPEHAWLSLTDTGGLMKRYWLGVSNDPTLGGRGGETTPVAPTRRIGSQKSPEDDVQGPEVQTRQNVRIRIISVTCVPPVGEKMGQLFSENGLSEQTFSAGGYRYCED